MNKKEIRFLNTIPSETITLNEKSDLLLVGLVTKGWQGTRNLIIEGASRGSRCQSIFFILGKNNDSFCANITTVHRADNTLVHTHIRTALTASAISNISGLAKVEEKINGADSYFSHHSLLLSDSAMSKTAPNLEIKSDSVKAGHAASVGKIDEDALFYLQSRGINEQDAKSLLVAGFFETEFSLIPDEEIKNKISKTIADFLLK